MKKAKNSLYLNGFTYHPIELPHESSSSALRGSISRNESRSDTKNVAKQDSIDSIMRQNVQLRERESIYIQKLLSLESGLQTQHREFIELQELYTSLFETYKAKEAEVSQLETKFRETNREREDGQVHSFRKSTDDRNDTFEQAKSHSSRSQELLIKEREIMQKEQQWHLQEREFSEKISSLTEQLNKITHNFERVSAELAHLRNAPLQKISEKPSKQQSPSAEAETILKLQYENQFLQKRNEDIEKDRLELQRVIASKQKEITKLRSEKIAAHRLSNQRIYGKSPLKENRAITKHQHPQSVELHQERNYFSFSRDAEEGDLPSFPPELEIDSLIQEHSFK